MATNIANAIVSNGQINPLVILGLQVRVNLTLYKQLQMDSIRDLMDT